MNNFTQDEGFFSSKIRNVPQYVKGPWIEVVPSTPGNFSRLSIKVNFNDISDIYLLDIGLGESGKEVVFVADMQIEYNCVSKDKRGIFATTIVTNPRPKNRIAVRAQSIAGSSESFQIALGVF